MPERDRRGTKPPAPKPDVPWLKDRPDLHRTEDTDVLEDTVPPTPIPKRQEGPKDDQRVPGSERREPPPQSGVPGVQGDATKARRRPS